MKLHKLTAMNFMPYKGETAVDFPTDDTRNVMIVFGDNMRGKTSLLNAIRWAFYGRAIGRHSRAIQLQDIVNREAALEDDWKVQVFVQFEANGHSYDLRRSATRRTHVATPQRPEDFSTTVQLTIDGVPTSGDQVETEINQIAPEQVSRFFLFDGELLQEYESLLVEGSDQGRQIKEAIEHVLGVPSLIHGRTELGAILKAATKQQSRDLSHIQGLEKQAERQQDLTARQDTHERDLAKLQDRLNSTRAERERLDDDLDAAASILAAKGRIDGLKQQKNSLEELQKRKTVERRSLLAQAWLDLLDSRLQIKRDLLQNRQTVLMEGWKRQGQLQTKVDALKGLLTTGSCPTCGQDMANHRRDEIGLALGTLQAELNSDGGEHAELQAVSAQLAALSKIRGVNARDRLAEIDRDRKKAEVDLQRSENEIERLKEEVAGHDTAELARKRVLQQEALKEEGRLQTNILTVRKEIEQVREELAVAQKAIEGLASARSQKSTLKVSIATDLERTFTASIERLRDKLRTKVEALASDAFLHMTTQKGYRGLEINTNYGLTILDKAGRKVPL